MLTLTKRPLYFAGLTILSFGLWIVLQPGLLHVGGLEAVRRTRLGQQDEGIPTSHTLVHSVSTWDGKFFRIDMGGELAMNPNIIPHPILDDAWILVAQLRQETQYFAELVCTANFHQDVLKCIDDPSKLPIAPTFGDKCTGDLAYIALNQGPHDARVFYGPRKPYTIYGSNSIHTCFGQWAHDFRSLVQWGFESDESPDDFASATELQRPPPWSAIEKNWFLFWDLDGQMYVHYDLVPNRVFASVHNSGAVGPNLGSFARNDDEECMAKFMPNVGPEHESIHQATNSLSITVCTRDDESCTPDISNTFIFTIYQHKAYYNFHAVYEPYILLFEQVPPFKIHAISTKPFWIHGRNVRASQAPLADQPEDTDPFLTNVTHTVEQMLYVTSMSWKNKGQRYHGYIDDVLFIAFGVEDEETAAIDVVVGDLMQNLGFC